jgi:hypothetical protein
MDTISTNPILLIMAGIIVLAIFYLRLIVWLIPHLRRLYSYMVAMKREYQALDRGDTLTLLRDAGLSQEQSLWFYEKFYDNATCLERCLIKLYIEKHCFQETLHS